MSHLIEHGMVAPAPEHLLQWIQAVSYTHLTLPTIRSV